MISFYSPVILDIEDDKTIGNALMPADTGLLLCISDTRVGHMAYLSVPNSPESKCSSDTAQLTSQIPLCLLLAMIL